MEHGTNNRYSKGCRCEPCKQAGREYRALKRVFTHNNAGYAHGCRCDICGAARLAYQRRKRGTRRPEPSKYDTPTPSAIIAQFKERFGARS